MEAIAQAKEQAVADFLSTAAPRREFAALAVTTAYEQNIVGVGIGPKIRKGKQTATMSIRFYVEKKVALKAIQPGLLDGGAAPADRIARLKKFVKIRKLPADNHVDGAIAASDAPKLASPLILPSVGAIGSTTPVPATVGMRVHKHGRTTGYTRERVIDVSADVNITYDFGAARFVDQMIKRKAQEVAREVGVTAPLVFEVTGELRKQ